MNADTNGLKDNNYAPFYYENQFFNPYECTVLIDEIHKLFQYIDTNDKGFLEIDELIDF